MFDLCKKRSRTARPQDGPQLLLGGCCSWTIDIPNKYHCSGRYINTPRRRYAFIRELKICQHMQYGGSNSTGRLSTAGSRSRAWNLFKRSSTSFLSSPAVPNVINTVVTRPPQQIQTFASPQLRNPSRHTLRLTRGRLNRHNEVRPRNTAPH